MRFDQLDKTLLGRALSLLGEVRREHEVAADAQRADTYFRPTPGRHSQRARLGLLGRMAKQPCLFEVFHTNLSFGTFDACVRKQLTLGHLASLEAKKAGQRLPPRPWLWILTTGRPSGVLRGHALAPMPGFPAGFYGGPPAAAVGVVVLRELPRNRATLFFRVLGAGEVLALALHDLTDLPADAWERDVAIEPLLALRIEMPKDDLTADERRILMATQDLFEKFKERLRHDGLQQGLQQGAGQVLIAVYETRFGAIPVALREAIERAADEKVLTRWAAIVGTRSESEIAKALLTQANPRPQPRRASPRRKSAAPRRS